MLENLGVASELPSDPEVWHQWMKTLCDKAELQIKRGNLKELWWNSDCRGDIAKMAKAVFGLYRDKIGTKLNSSIPVPFLHQNKEGKSLAFASSEEVFQADKSYLTESSVESVIIQKEFKIFFLTLKQGDGFGLKNLSDALELRPDFGDTVPEESKKLMKLYQERRDILNLIASCELPEDIRINVRTEMHLRSQRYSDIVPDVGFWYDSDKKILDVSTVDDQLEDLAYGLAKIIEKDSGGDFCIMLTKKGREKCIETLRKHHRYSPEALEKLELDFSGASPEPVTADNEVSEPQQPQSTHDPSRIGISQNDVKSEADMKTGISGDSNGRHGGPKPPSHPPHGETKHGHHTDSGTPKIKVEPDYLWGPERGGPRKLGVSNDADDGEYEARDSDGKRGEKALLKWLKAKYGADNVTNMNEQIPNNPGYDILVVKNGEEHYYECKSFVSATPPRRILMTKAQFEKAKSAPNRYWLCVIYDLYAAPVKMLEPICNPNALGNEPVITKYKIDLTHEHDKAFSAIGEK